MNSGNPFILEPKTQGGKAPKTSVCPSSHRMQYCCLLHT